MKNQKVFIVGAGGMVGATTAYALTIKEIVSEVVLIDISQDMARGQAMDISDATTFTNGVNVRTGDYSEIDTNDIIVITGGAPQKPGQSRLELLDINKKIIEDIVADIMKNGKEVFIVLVTNPVDVLAHVALRASGLPKNRVFGTGTALDSARLQVEIASHINVAPSQVSAYTMGEHGDSSFSALSSARVGNVPLADMPGYHASWADHLDSDISQKAYHIINTKRATFYGIGQVASEIVAALTRPVPTIMPVSSLLEGEYDLNDVMVSVPHLISSEGVKPIDDYPLNEEEYKKLQESARVVSEAYQKTL